MATNNEKILKALENENESITTTELANKTGIDVKNVSRYLKALENKGFIVRKTIQKGKIRVVMIKLNTTFSEEEIALANIGKGNDFLEVKPKPVKIQALKPPKQPPKPPKPIIDYEGIDFDKIANSSEFKRFIFMIRTGSTFRGSNVELDKKLQKTEQEINFIKEIGRGTHQDFRSVVSELKEALAKRKSKIEIKVQD